MPSEDVVPNYEFPVNQEDNQQVNVRLNQLSNWLDTINGILDSFKQYRDVQSNDFNIANKKSNIEDLNSFLDSLPESFDQLTDLAEVINQSIARLSFSKEETAVLLKRAETLSISIHKLVEFKSQIQANIAEAMTQEDEISNQALLEITSILLKNGKKLLKGTGLEWLSRNDELAGIVEGRPDDISHYVKSLVGISKEFHEKKSLKYRVMSAFPKNRQLFAELEKQLQIFENSKKNSRDLISYRLPYGWMTSDIKYITNVSASVVIDTLAIWMYEDCDGERLENIQEQISLSSDLQEVRERYYHDKEDISQRILTQIVGEDPSENAITAYKNVNNDIDIHMYKTQRHINSLLDKKLYKIWEASYKDTYDSYKKYKNELKSINPKAMSIDVNIDRQLWKLRSHSQDKLLRISQQFIDFFREKYPTEASLIKDELIELENQAKTQVIEAISTEKEMKMPGTNSVFILREARDFFELDVDVINYSLREILTHPSAEYYSLLFKALKDMVPQGLAQRQIANLTLAAASACISQLPDDEKSTSYLKIWHDVVRLSGRSENFAHTLNSMGSFHSTTTQIYKERFEFFQLVKNHPVEFHDLISKEFPEKRMDSYEKILSNFDYDTVVFEALLNNELSFENSNPQTLNTLYNIMLMNYDNVTEERYPSFARKPSVPVPEVHKLFEKHIDIDSQIIKTLNLFRNTHKLLGFKLDIFVFRKILEGNDVSEEMGVIENYFTMLEQQVPPKDDVVKQVVDIVCTSIDISKIVTILEEASGNDLDSWILLAQEKSSTSSDKIFLPVLKSNLNKMYEELGDPEELKVTEDNWKTILYVYIQSEADLGYMVEVDGKLVNKIKELFKEDDIKDFCYTRIHSQWKQYLKSGDLKEFPYELVEIAEIVDHHMGAGPLKYITSLTSFSKELRESYIESSTAETTTIGVYEGIRDLETRFENERWSQKQRADFYNISVDVLKTAPSLYDQFLEFFSSLNKNELSDFATTSYPLFQARLTLLDIARDENKVNKNTSARTLVNIRKELREIQKKIDGGSKNERSEVLSNLKEHSLEDIKHSFKEAFGIIKIPEEFTSESIRSIQNSTRYLANVAHRDRDVEAKLAFFLALKLNNQWDSFRQFEIINLDEYFDSNSVYLPILVEYLEKRLEFSKPIASASGISQEDLPEFYQLLNQENSNMALMNIQTADEKLELVMRSLEELVDPDVYDSQIEKSMIVLYGTHGVRTVNKVLGQSFQELKGIELDFDSDAERKAFLMVQPELKSILEENSFDWSTNSISLVQKQTRSVATIQKTKEFVSQRDIPNEIDGLRNALVPPSNIVDVFQKLGEDFTTESGAIAVGRDLDYLENLVVKHREELTPNELESVNLYLESVKTRLVTLENIYDSIKQKFVQLSRSVHETENLRLKNRFDELQKIINQEDEQKEYSSIATNNINLVIENIRACLGCLQKEINNDTNITFGDANKFFVMTKNPRSEGSMSDQIVLAEPVTHDDGTEELSLVFDRLYGVRSADIFMNHVEVVLKKYSAVKERFPDSKISLFITSAALSTAGVSHESFIQKLEENIGTLHEAHFVQNTVINVLESAGSDPYIEFGGDSRDSGNRNVNGVVIRL